MPGAVEMRDALPELSIQGRIGVNSGEVVTGTEERLATGDAVNVAARFEQAAEPGEVLIGSVTLGFVGDAVEVGEERLLELKGKRAPVAAYSLVSVREGVERSHGSRFVGREPELRQLVDAWETTLGSSRCELVTVVGDPGVGKSRLVAEALAQIEARVVRGRCLSYGEGITYWPVVAVVKQLDSFPSDEVAANAIRSLLGESETPVGTDEIAWAAPKPRPTRSTGAFPLALGQRSLVRCDSTQVSRAAPRRTGHMRDISPDGIRRHSQVRRRFADGARDPLTGRSGQLRPAATVPGHLGKFGLPGLAEERDAGGRPSLAASGARPALSSHACGGPSSPSRPTREGSRSVPGRAPIARRSARASGVPGGPGARRERPRTVAAGVPGSDCTHRIRLRERRGRDLNSRSA
jgi:AAA ATPase domain/Adenylate and Guanylate cyclase catalytic domain